GALAQAGGRAVAPALFPLPPTGWPATALFWKNMTAVLRRRRARNIGLGLAGAGALLAATSGDPGGLAQMGGALTLTWLGFALLLGPQWIRNDLRGDLAHADLLRSYPLPGWSIVASETAASAVTLTLLQLGLALLAYPPYLRGSPPLVAVGAPPAGVSRFSGGPAPGGGPQYTAEPAGRGGAAAPADQLH